MSTHFATTPAPTVDFRELRDRIAGDVVAPQDEQWDSARSAWNLAVDQRPAAVALPESAADVVEVVRFAGRHGFRVAPQGTGHNAAALGGALDDTILIKTERMRNVTKRSLTGLETNASVRIHRSRNKGVSVDTYVILRRNGWRSPEDLGAAAERSRRVGDEEMPDDVRWIRSYVLEEDGGSVGTVCIYQATSVDAIRKHASLADLPADDIIRVADTVLVRPDPAPAPA